MESETNFAFIIGLAFFSFAFLVMIIAIVGLTSKRKLLEKDNKFHISVIQAEETLKRKIAADLHDDVAALVANSSRNMQHHISLLEKDGVNVSQLKEDAKIFSEISEKVREVAHDLVPKLFSSHGLIKALEKLINDFNKDGSSVAQFLNNTEKSTDPPLSKEKQLIVYRIVSEIAHNLKKHAHYKYLTIAINEMDSNFVLLFSHDGAGITNDEISGFRDKGSGIGLKSLHSRALSLDAKIDYTKDQGVSHVELTIPLTNEGNN
jgi:two-component system NarL family sensor kinase